MTNNRSAKQLTAVWQEISKKELFSRYGRKIDEVLFKLPNGEIKEFIIKNEGPVVGILALTEQQDVILARQFRPGLREVLDELPGGYIDTTDKSPQDAAERELLEETGYAGVMEFVGIIYDDAYSTMKRYCFVAKNCKKIQPAKLDDNEYIQLVTIPLEQFRELLRSGKMTDIELGYSGLDHLGLLT